MWNLLFGFVLGYLFAVFVIYILNLGRTILILKQLQYIVAAIFTYMEECMLEATVYKEMAMDESDISEKAKKARKMASKKAAKSMKND